MHYWPEFGVNGKESVTVETLLSHQVDTKLLVTHYWPKFGVNGKESVTVETLLSHQINTSGSLLAGVWCEW